jgi:gas vesicle protein
MKEEPIKRGPFILVPFLVGGVVGAGLSLLYTPKSGKEVREGIKRFANDSKESVSTAFDKGKVFYNDSKERVSMAIDKGKGLYKGLYDDSKERVSMAIGKGKELYDDGRVVLGKAIEAGKTVYVKGKEKWQHI